MVGIVCTKTTPYEIAKQAIADASYVCRRTHGDAPKVELIGRPDLSFSYIPSHMSYILLELLKNSMRATVEFHGVDNKMPPIKVIIADSEDNEDVCFHRLYNRTQLFSNVVLTFFTGCNHCK